MIIKCSFCGREFDKKVLDKNGHNVCPFCGGNVEYQSIQKEYDFKQMELETDLMKTAIKEEKKKNYKIALVIIGLLLIIGLTSGIAIFLNNGGFRTMKRPGRPNYENNKDYAGYYLYEDEFFYFNGLGWSVYRPTTNIWERQSATPKWVMEHWDITDYTSSESDFTQNYADGDAYFVWFDKHINEEYGEK